MERFILFFLFFSSPIVHAQSFDAANWRRETTHLSIDKNFTLNDSLTIEGVSYNYSRFYPDQKFTEYGNVSSDLKAIGSWIYLNNKGAVFLKGTAANGYKVGSWDVIVGNDRSHKNKYAYQWKADSSETVLMIAKNKNYTLRKKK